MGYFLSTAQKHHWQTFEHNGLGPCKTASQSERKNRPTVSTTMASMLAWGKGYFGVTEPFLFLF